jgi:hypothetical protein
MLLRRLLFWVLSAFIAIAMIMAPATAEPRTALVIGNSAYPFSPLLNPANDAADVAEALRGTGFDVTLKLDTDRAAMLDAIRGFGERLKASKGMGLFFFAGHGVQINGENYLVPVAAGFEGEADLMSRAVKATEVVDAMAAAGNHLNIVVLDACRDNGLGRSSTRGLSRIDTNARLFISYSTSPGSVAQDGTGRNSPYTKHLVDAIRLPDLALEQTFKNTLKGVYQETRGKQTPWISSSFFGDFIFHQTQNQAPGKDGAVAALPGGQGEEVRNASLRQTEAASTLAGIYRVDGRNPGGRRYQGMVAVTQTGDQFAFKWWIGTQLLEGTGQLAGRMLVINWGDKTPVVYTFGPLQSLDGEWADGSATERLVLHARAAGNPVALKGGAYAVVGHDKTGRKYQGAVTITPEGDRYRLDWKIGTNAYTGEGTLNGNLLTVNWGSVTPVVYALAADGSLNGLWDTGFGDETLTPER